MTVRYAPRNLQGLPTLTEVIELPVAPGAAEPPPELEPQAPRADMPIAASGPDLDQAQLVGKVLAELQRHTELMLEQRLREAIEPALARAADTLVHELREELAATLRDVVARSVSQELARQRDR